MTTQRLKPIVWGLGIATALALLVTLYLGLVWSPPERSMGESIRILYFHAPSAWASYLAIGVVAIASIMYLWRRTRIWDVIALASAEIGVLFTTITALNVAGVDTTLITSNILVVMAGILLAFGIAYGHAARDVLSNILGSYYGKDRFKPGMRVRVGNDEGVIEKIDSISITIRTHDRLVLLPTRQLITERIEIIAEPEEPGGGVA